MLRQLAIALASISFIAAPAHTAPTANAGSAERLVVLDPTGSALHAFVWTPVGDATGLPLIVMSHGSGGEGRNHEQTARALAAAGFVVAALTHTGDNWRDRSETTDVRERPRHLRLLVDHMLARWPGRTRLNAERVGAFGFSAGAFTALVAAGGEPNLAKVRDHCLAHPTFFDCRLSPAGATPPSGTPWTHDPRIKAVVAAAPALGFTFGENGLANVRVPVQLWRAGADEVLPHRFYAEAVAIALPRRPDYHVVDGAGHFDFLPPCSASLAQALPELCRSAPGFDRAAFHSIFEREVVSFFRKHL